MMSIVTVMTVTKAEPHPNADALRLYQMEAPELGAKQIIANLENVYEVGDNVIVALSGAVLKDGTQIRDTKIRGLPSYGMAMGTTDKSPGANLTEDYCALVKYGRPTMIKWPDIEGLHNVVRGFDVMKENLGDGFSFPTVTYYAKIKLHGTNASVQIHPDGTVVAQSRTDVITPEKDNAGFARWVHNNEDHFKQLARDKTIIFYGEWCGPGIQKNTAISDIGRKIFAVFCIHIGGPTELAVYQPDSAVITDWLGPKHPDIFVIPWVKNSDGQNVEYHLDYNEKESLRKSANYINELVAEVEREDPWVKETFGVSGVGEGIVLYPVKKDGQTVSERTDFSELMFKAKGEKHKVVKQKEAAQIDPEVAANIDEFVGLFVTEARLEQGVAIACNGQFDVKLTGSFLKWFNKDVEKESVAELEASKLEWKQVAKAVSSAAREWYQNKAKAL
jgi:tRNA-binding EMAP/Myf-like protein